MVNKNLCRDVTRKCLYSKTDLPNARVLSEPICHSSAKIWYLVYRWLLLFLWTIILICSIFQFGSYRPKVVQRLWPIYLTNWDLIFGTVQSLLGAILVTKRWRMQKDSNFEADRMTLSRTEKTYWCLYIITASLAVGVTITYWVAVHDPAIHVVDPPNILSHVCNSVLVLVDIFVSNVPFRIRSFWWCPLVVIVYLIFSLIYYVSGGTNNMGQHYIYKVLDWGRPDRSLLVCLGGLTFVVVLHYLLYFSSLFRDFACKKMCQANKEADKTIKENSQLDIITMKKTEIIV